MHIDMHQCDVYAWTEMHSTLTESENRATTGRLGGKAIPLCFSATTASLDSGTHTGKGRDDIINGNIHDGTYNAPY